MIATFQKTDPKRKEANRKGAAVVAPLVKDSRLAIIGAFKALAGMLARMSNKVDLEGKVPYGTDGDSFIYEPLSVARTRVQQDGQWLCHLMMHSLLHCIFRHALHSEVTDRRAWEVACDIAVTRIMHESMAKMDKNYLKTHWRMTQDQLNLISTLGDERTAERILPWVQAQQNIDQLEQFFKVDDHFAWWPENRSTMQLYMTAGSGGEEGQDGNDGQTPQNGQQGARPSDAELGDKWTEASAELLSDLQNFFQGDGAGALTASLRALNREKYDYAKWLQRFATRTEAMKINDDEFDLGFYQVGQHLIPGHRLAFIEPLEYKDVKRIKDFVIAIDTSGSTSGELVQSFLQKTYNIFESKETFNRRFRIHIIQCDAAIQEDAVVTSKEEFDRYIKDFQIKGLGGTDFRPVFDRVAQLKEEGAFNDLKGLIYFTDGFGTFPEKRTPYETAFVFVAKCPEDVPAIPGWAQKLVLEPSEI
jgi:predicted metal-dependent peptidase